MNLIVAVDNNWAIGYKNDLLISIPDDMKFFRETTTGNVIIIFTLFFNGFPFGKLFKVFLPIIITFPVVVSLKNFICLLRSQIWKLEN